MFLKCGKCLYLFATNEANVKILLDIAALHIQAIIRRRKEKLSTKIKPITFKFKNILFYVNRFKKLLSSSSVITISAIT